MIPVCFQGKQFSNSNPSLAPQPGIKPISSALEGEVLTTRSPEKSLDFFREKTLYKCEVECYAMLFISSQSCSKILCCG